MKPYIKIPNIKLDPKAFDKARFKRLFSELAHVVLARSEDNLSSGVNMMGGEVKPGGYSKSYREAIEKGQVFGKTDPDLVNLLSTGDMRRARQVQDSQNGMGAEVRFNSPEEANKAQHLHERGFANWHGMGPSEIEYADRKVDELVVELMNKLIE